MVAYRVDNGEPCPDGDVVDQVHGLVPDPLRGEVLEVLQGMGQAGADHPLRRFLLSDKPPWEAFLEASKTRDNSIITSFTEASMTTGLAVVQQLRNTLDLPERARGAAEAVAAGLRDAKAA